MNYLNLIVIIAIFFFVVDKYQTITKSNITSSYIKDNDRNSVGFVKPEHRLLNTLNNISSGSKIQLKGRTTKSIYNKNTISVELNERLLYVIKDIINSINTIALSDFFIKKIENVYIMIDSKQSQRYIVDFFIYDVNNFYTIRLIGDIVIIDEEIYINYLHVQSGSNSSLMNKYDIKFNSIGILFDSNMFHEDLVKVFDNYYSNTFQVIGVNDTNLEYSNEDLTSVLTLNSLKNNHIPSSVSSVSSDTYKDLSNKKLSGYLDMYLPNSQTTTTSSTFCDKYSINWDTDGIMVENNNNDPNCHRNNNQTIPEINKPWFGPGVIYDRSSNDQYRWLKDPGRKNMIGAQY